jgi:HPt (histidine-containing phosphotransfer) domain-containing protein
MTGADASGAIDPRAIAMLERVGGRKLLLRMITLFLDDAPLRLVKAQSSAATGDADGVANACHALKSSAGQLGALRLQEECARGEALAASGGGGDFTALVDGIIGDFHVARRGLEALRDSAQSDGPATSP